MAYGSRHLSPWRTPPGHSLLSCTADCRPILSSIGGVPPGGGGGPAGPPGQGLPEAAAGVHQAAPRLHHPLLLRHLAPLLQSLLHTLLWQDHPRVHPPPLPDPPPPPPPPAPPPPPPGCCRPPCTAAPHPRSTTGPPQ